MPDPAPPPLLSWLRLCRAPNVFTALADVSMGYLVARPAVDEIGVFACLAGASACLYTSGMVLNDVLDIEIDRKERPFRPLPSGQISLTAARIFGFGLMLVGIVLAAAAGYATTATDTVQFPWRSGAMGLAIALSVLLYDGFLKKTSLGPLGMGLCRFFNVLLGYSVAQDAAGPNWLLYYEPMQVLAAASIGLYITGLTWFARGEAGQSPTLHLLGGIAVMAGGICLIGWWGSLMRPPQGNLGLNATYTFWILLAVMALLGLRRCFEGVADPQPALIQAAVKQCILSLILLDAAMTAFGTGRPEFGLGVAFLLAPTFLLGRWVYST